MTAYAIGHLTLQNQDWLPEYSAKIGTVIQKHGGKVIAKGKPQHLEGKKELADVVISIEFDDFKSANAWYQDEDNQKLVTLRQSGSSFDLVLVEAL